MANGGCALVQHARKASVVRVGNAPRMALGGIVNLLTTLYFASLYTATKASITASATIGPPGLGPIAPNHECFKGLSISTWHVVYWGGRRHDQGQVDNAEESTAQRSICTCLSYQDYTMAWGGDTRSLANDSRMIAR